jgi:nitronate monooxygenase
MSGWPDRRLLDLFGIDVPIIQAPMAGPGTPELAMAVSDAGGLGSLPCAQLSVDEARTALDRINADASRRLNLNFFCHAPPAAVLSTPTTARWSKPIGRRWRAFTSACPNAHCWSE